MAARRTREVNAAIAARSAHLGPILRGAMPAGHPLNIGMLGMHGARYTNQVLNECDLLVCVGARFDDRATGRPETFAPLARIVHIDIDAREFGKIKTPTLAIQDDAMAALQHLLQRTAPTIRPRWLARVAELRGALSTTAH